MCGRRIVSRKRDWKRGRQRYTTITITIIIIYYTINNTNGQQISKCVCVCVCCAEIDYSSSSSAARARYIILRKSRVQSHHRRREFEWKKLTYRINVLQLLLFGIASAGLFVYVCDLIKKQPQKLR